MKKIFFILALCLLAVLGVAGTFAYYQSQIRVDNPFYTGEAKIRLSEKFNESDHWVPGEEKEKQVWFENVGNMDLLLRFTLEVTLQDEAGKDIQVQTGADKTVYQLKDGTKICTLNWADANMKNWTYKEGYYYYNSIFKANEKTYPTLKSVTFSKELSNEVHGIRTDYSRYQLKIKVLGEAAQVSQEATKELWEQSYTLVNDIVTWK